MGETEEFNALTFEKKLAALKDTQESIQGLSTWCLKQREHHKKIVQSWLNVLKRVKVEQRLVLFYLANDVIQYSKRKNYEFVESWGLNLQKATPLVREEKVRKKILRIFKIWEQRQVYDEEFLSDLTGLLSAGAVKKADDDPLDFQPQQLVNKIKQCSVLESDTDLRLKHIHESHLQLSDTEALCTSLKDRSNKDEVEKELNEGIAVVERYTAALQREIVAREALLLLLSSAGQYYSTQRGEVKVVAYAYKNFGSRVRQLKRKLDELIPTLPASVPSPPQRDEDVPSPGPDEDLELPNLNDADDVSYNIDKTFNTSLTADGSLYNLGLSSFLDSDAMALFQDAGTQGHEALDSSILSQKSQDALPGLDLLTPDIAPVPPPTSFYGSVIDITDDSDQQYHPEPITSQRQWNNANNTHTTWNVSAALPPPPVPPVPPALPALPALPSLPSLPALAAPASPPPPVYTPSAFPPPVPPVPAVPAPQPAPAAAVMHSAPPASPPHALTLYTPDMPSGDVDHRGLLPPPPPPPVIPTLSVLSQLEDVDHRLLPTLPPPPPVSTANRHHNSNQDVDHRNLISLTHQPSPQPPQRPIGRGLDQDYRVPPPLGPPPDIVESVDMDLSEDEDQGQSGMYENSRRSSFNQNNKVLVGGDNGKTNHNNLIRINSMPTGDRPYQDTLDAPASAPTVQPLSNPFDKMPSGLMNQQFRFREDPRRVDDENNRQFRFREDPRRPEPEETTPHDGEYEEDLRSRSLELQDPRNSSPPVEFEEFEGDWGNAAPMPGPRFMNQRFPRNWSPRTNFRPPGFGPQPPFWPRNGPRGPYGQRPRFW